MTDPQPCAHFVNADGHALCLVGRNPTLDGCGRGCPAYLPDSERQPCEVWTRVMGYHRPVSAFNRGKRAEYDERRLFLEPH
ncbi:hypothetical protein Thivi_4421 [Thiocystis violascens DSM 198]|uniref:Uncharacterized protein n=1 Tax=Thiocystis violascens (strain ATCC 17096 / DSM 198 / 6111) TaxID=765911 RepID=I3YGV6_THIV6|nr:hypothetical protein Thivi_4421 [Thiocystis violascens DSM 198]